MVPLGSKVRDTITGFEGIAIARISYLYGCVHIGIIPTILKEGSTQRERLFDEQRVQVLIKTDRIALEPKINLGYLARDKITGFDGIVTTWCDELNRVPMVGITPTKLNEGKLIEPLTFPESHLELIRLRHLEINEDSSVTSDDFAREILV